jgi:hypothetical protein
LRRDLNAEVELIGGPYGKFEVVIDGETVVDGGAWAALGILPSGPKVVEAVRARLGSISRPTDPLPSSRP